MTVHKKTKPRQCERSIKSYWTGNASKLKENPSHS